MHQSWQHTDDLHMLQTRLDMPAGRMQCCRIVFRQVSRANMVPATLTMPPQIIPSIIAAPDGGMNCT